MELGSSSISRSRPWRSQAAPRLPRGALVTQCRASKGPPSRRDLSEGGLGSGTAAKAASVASNSSTSQQYLKHILNLSGLGDRGSSGSGAAAASDPASSSSSSSAAVSGSAPIAPVASQPEEETEISKLQRSVERLSATNQQLVADMQRIVSSLADLVQTMPQPSVSSVSSSSGEDLPLAGTRPAARANGTQPAAPQAGEEATPDSMACQVRHPGALCCTKTTTRHDPETRSCTITLETVAKCSSDHSAQRTLSADDLATLAAQAALSTASALCRAKTAAAQGQVHPQEAVQQHAALIGILSDGDILSAQRNPVSQFGHESFLLLLRDPITQRRVRAMFKPRVEGDAGGWHRAPIEWVAYELNLLLGLDLVPPVAYRSGGITLKPADGEAAQYKEGALMYWAEGAGVLDRYPVSQWSADKELLLTDTRILDVLIHNSDRHRGHFLLGRHWATGSWDGDRWMGEMRPMLIDHAAGFRREAHVTMQHENAFQTGPVRCVSAATYLRLRFLDAATISSKFASVLSEQEMRELLQRRNYVLRYLDGLVEEQGYAATVKE